MVEVVQHRVYISPRLVPVCQQKNVRFQELYVVSHKQVHQCAVSKAVCAMSSGRYLNLRGRGSSFDRSRIARHMANLDKNDWVDSRRYSIRKDFQPSVEIVEIRQYGFRPSVF